MKRTTRYSREEASSRKEARLLRSLHHRNVISFLGEMVTRTAHVIFLELAAAGSVEHILHRFGRFNDNRKLQLNLLLLNSKYLEIKYTATQVIRGLAYMHNVRNIVHL